MPRKLRATSCPTASGTIISALMSSSPTIRIETTTVTAVSTASSGVEREHVHAGRPRVLLVVADGEQPRREHGHEPEDDDGSAAKVHRSGR